MLRHISVGLIVLISALAVDVSVVQAQVRRGGGVVVGGGGVVAGRRIVSGPVVSNDAAFLAINGRRSFCGWPGGGNTGNVYACGPGFSAFFGSIGPWSPWGWSNWNCGPVWRSGWGPGCGWGWSNNVCFTQPWIFSGNDLFGPNLEELWNPLGLGNGPLAPQVNIIQVQPRDGVIDVVPGDALPGDGFDGNAVPGDVLPGNAVPEELPADGFDGNGNGNGAERDAPKVREANAAALARAWRWIDLGDKYFGKQEYRQAYQRYKEAAKSAPGLVEVYLRQGQAMVASGQYALAAPSFRRALKLDADLAQARFQLADLYGGNRLAQKAHLEALAAAAEKDPASGDLLLLVGAQLFFDGQTQRARPFWQQAAAMLAPADQRLSAIVSRVADEAEANVARPVAAPRDDV